MKKAAGNIFVSVVALFLTAQANAQVKQESDDSLVMSNSSVRVVIDKRSGKVNYRFLNGISFNNSVAYVEDVKNGYFSTDNLSVHSYTIDEIQDPVGKGVCINLEHSQPGKPVKLVQHITIYETRSFLLITAEAESTAPGQTVQTRNISPFSILPAQQGSCFIPGTQSHLVDYPFDNDNWVDVVSRKWPAASDGKINGTSYEFVSVHDENTRNGFVIGSLLHDCWKTGIRYATGNKAGLVDSLIVYGGAATKDNPSLPASYGGYDGTHDYIEHGIVSGESVRSPLIWLSAGEDVRDVLMDFGKMNAKLAGSLKWNGYAPVYWNSFGVEDVLGYRKVMMPAGVVKISDFIHSLKEFNKYSKPVLSIDSYDQTIYSTDVLKSVSRYGKKKDQQMGFYFIPFAVWTWKNSVDQTMLGATGVGLKDVVLRDHDHQPIPYKNGDWAAYPIDPTHPATRAYIIAQLQKAKAIEAKFIKIDFLSAGALESATRYDQHVSTGMQAYSQGMKMLKQLVDSIMGPDIFITMAISPMFPHQFAHTRFVSTDVYSHLRNDQPGFPHYGSTGASMISASHLWWVQGTLWPYTNMDVAIMKNFQKNPDLTEKEIKVRLYSMISLGSILGDGSDFRNKIAAERARKFLDNAQLCSFFSKPKAFTPLRFSEGNDASQQLSFYLPGDTILASVFNFDKEKQFVEVFEQKDLRWKNGKYRLLDFLTGELVGSIEEGQTSFSLTVPVTDALLVNLVRVNE